MAGVIGRRQLLKTATGLTLAGSAFFSPRTPAKPFALTTVHEQAAAIAQRLAAGRQAHLRLLLPRGSKANVHPVAQQFSALTGIEITYLETPVDDINTIILIESLTQQNTFDVALPATFGIPDLVAAQALLPLDDYAQHYQPTNYQSDALYTLGDYYTGTLYGYQTDGDTYLLFYNRDWLEDEEENKRFADQHGYPLNIAETWAELDAMMAFFQRPQQQRFGGTLFRTPDYIAWEWWIRFHAQGSYPVDDDFEPQINNAAGVQALEQLITASQYQYPQARSNGLFANWRAFAQGNAFCNIGWGGTQKYLNSPQSAIKGRLAFGATPGGRISGQLLSIPYFNWGWNYTVARDTREPELAYLFILFACSPAMSTLAVRQTQGYFDPFRAVHYHDPQIITAYGPEFLQAHQYSMRYSIPDFYVQGQGEYFGALRAYLVKADRDQMNPRAALDTVAKLWRQITRRIGTDKQIQQWAFVKSRYPEAVRTRLS